MPDNSIIGNGTIGFYGLTLPSLNHQLTSLILLTFGIAQNFVLALRSLNRKIPNLKFVIRNLKLTSLKWLRMMHTIISCSGKFWEAGSFKLFPRLKMRLSEKGSRKSSLPDYLIQCNEAVEEINKYGSKRWKEENGYHK